VARENDYKIRYNLGEIWCKTPGLAIIYKYFIKSCNNLLTLYNVSDIIVM
jgi:hypothetical protein